MDNIKKFPSFYEGDYIKTVECFFFAVKGLFHPKDFVIAYLRYLPDVAGERRLGKNHYRRVYDLEETTVLLQNKNSKYLNHIKELGLTLQSVPVNMIVKVYKPRERLMVLMENSKDDLEDLVVRFTSTLSKLSGVPLDRFGVSGSVLIGMAHQKSDIDLIVYGEEEGLKTYEVLKSLRETSKVVSSYDERTVGGVLNARWGDVGLNLDRFMKIEISKVLQGIVWGREYFVRLVKKHEEVEEEIESKPIGRVKFRAVVANVANAIYTPCTYKVENLIFLNNFYDLIVSELLSFRGKFTEQARLGDYVEGYGTLEKVTLKDKTTFRIVMGSKGDYLIPIRK